MWPSRRSFLGRRGSASVLPAHRRQFPRDNACFRSMRARMFRSSSFRVAFLSGVLTVSANPVSIPAPSLSTRVVISVTDQKLMLIENGKIAASYPVSTSKYGLGDAWGSLATPLGLLQVAQKIGDHAPMGAVFHNRRWTGEILHPNTQIGRASCRERVEVAGVAG